MNQLSKSFKRSIAVISLGAFASLILGTTAAEAKPAPAALVASASAAKVGQNGGSAAAQSSAYNSSISNTLSKVNQPAKVYVNLVCKTVSVLSLLTNPVVAAATTLICLPL